MIASILFLMAPLTVIVQDVETTEGQIYVSVQTEADFGQQRGTAGSITDPETGNMEFEFDVPAGTYGVSIWHDDNANGQFDFEANGMPLDGYGVSNNGQYTFTDAAVEVGENGAIVRIDMTYPRD